MRHSGAMWNNLRLRRLLAALSLLLLPHSLPAAPPGEVTGLRFTARDTIVWDPGFATGHYNLYAGTQPAREDHACVMPGIATNTAVLPGAFDTLHYYLVSAVGTGGESTLGVRTDLLERVNTDPCDTDGDTLPDGSDNCPRVPNPDQADQDEDYEGDRCDPQTYDFEGDLLGVRPLEMTQVGGSDLTFLVRDIGADLGISYNETAPGVHDVFDRLPAGVPFQETTVYIDVEDVPEVCSVELWSEGAYGWNAGSGLILQVGANNQIYFYERRGTSVPQTPGPTLPASGRLRLRLIDDPGPAATMHVDGHDGASWQEDLTVFPVADDHLYRGLDTLVANYLGGRRGIRRVTVNHEVTPGNLLVAKHASWSEDWKVFQRDSDDQADIPVSFYYRAGEPVLLLAQIVDLATGLPLPGFTEDDLQFPLSMTPEGGASAVSVTAVIPRVPTGGNYDARVRLVRESDGMELGAGVLSNIAVGDVYLAGGQSNMSGYSGGLSGAETPIDEVHLFHNDGTWKRASEPMDDGTDQVDLVSRENPAHSLMLRFGKELSQATGVPIGIIPGSLGGTNLFAQWQRDESDHDNRGTLYGSLLHRARLQNYFTPSIGFIWFQGESDALASRSVTDYETDMSRLIAQYREDLQNPDLYVIQAQLGVFLNSNLPLWLGIQEAQRLVARSDPRVALVTTVDQPLSDAIHFNVIGYKEIGRRFGEAAREMIYGEPVDHLTELTQVRYGPTDNLVELVYDGDVTGGAIELYNAFDDLDFGPNLLSVTPSGNVITLEFDRDLFGNAFVEYGFSQDPAGPWVKDLRGVPVPCFFDILVQR